MFTASRESVEIKGKTTVFIDIGGMQYTCQVVVADIDVELIMGLDFLKTNECQICKSSAKYFINLWGVF